MVCKIMCLQRIVRCAVCVCVCGGCVVRRGVGRVRDPRSVDAPEPNEADPPSYILYPLIF